MERCVYQVDKRSNRAISYPVRGYGKFLVEDLGKTSKKGRQFITLAIFQ